MAIYYIFIVMPQQICCFSFLSKKQGRNLALPFGASASNIIVKCWLDDTCFLAPVVIE